MHVDHRSIPVNEIRAEVLDFARMIEARLRENTWRGDYHGVQLPDAIRRLKNELIEVETAVGALRFCRERLAGDVDDAVVLTRLHDLASREASDLATYCFILHTNVVPLAQASRAEAA